MTLFFIRLISLTLRESLCEVMKSSIGKYGITM